MNEHQAVAVVTQLHRGDPADHLAEANLFAQDRCLDAQGLQVPHQKPLAECDQHENSQKPRRMTAYQSAKQKKARKAGSSGPKWRLDREGGVEQDPDPERHGQPEDPGGPARRSASSPTPRASGQADRQSWRHLHWGATTDIRGRISALRKCRRR